MKNDQDQRAGEALLRTEAVAELIDQSPNSIRIMRHRGTGPKYIKIGRNIRYRPSEVEAWLNAQERATDEARRRSLQR